MAALNPSEAFIKIVHDELVAVMGAEHSALNLAAAPRQLFLWRVCKGPVRPQRWRNLPAC